MTTPQDLMIIALDVAPDRPVGRGDLALALAGAELIDLLAAEAASLADDLIVPGHPPPLADPLLSEAASSLVREAPYESVGDWLWRRGRDLPATYLAALESDGRLARQGRRGVPFRTTRMALADSPDRRRAADRWTAGEPVLTSLATAIGIAPEDPAATAPDDDTATTVLAAVNDALLELESVRQRRTIEDAAFDNIWRGN
ncbi:GPP34 family phosphoprotein [Streptomyces sp. NBC_01565]|uniref:GPP34 family phosphoprotein n=1 Tax=Streptomyces sp. NBC_01565 TaxID=2975881 RepID=UPI0022581028|nr:GPP34 family phosphoprotein [Streptomyces sp. NBC_01565]MCX4541113.1 GPP34 family phosphoprotein [Streptomyces sp. NBC_01565]